jgi:hypothetical protein
MKFLDGLEKASKSEEELFTTKLGTLKSLSLMETKSKSVTLNRHGVSMKTIMLSLLKKVKKSIRKLKAIKFQMTSRILYLMLPHQLWMHLS